MLQRIYTFIKQWETLSLLFSIYKDFSFIFTAGCHAKTTFGENTYADFAMKLFIEAEIRRKRQGKKNGINCTEIRRNLRWHC